MRPAELGGGWDALAWVTWTPMSARSFVFVKLTVAGGKPKRPWGGKTLRLMARRVDALFEAFVGPFGPVLLQQLF